MINIGLIGYGYWGPNLARNFNNRTDMKLSGICDFSADRLEKAGRLYPQLILTKNIDDLFSDTSLDAIAIATPVSTHFDMAYKALSTDKNLWVEQPITEKVEQAETLIDLASKKNKVLFVDHTDIYTGAIQKIKEIIEDGDLGNLIYYDYTRVIRLSSLCP